ncbi:MAG: glycosyltransferase family 39 protein [Bacteroidales bacterium]|nr:glycosyltransferase family 39 protein [Bacteroidales bacterium]
MISKLNTYTYFILFAILFTLIVGPTLFTDGMFMDGLIYAAISKNMALGLGSFWSPHLTQTLYPNFFQHPPLALGLQAFFFQLFGDSLLVERIYSLLSFFMAASLIVQLWKAIGKPEQKAWIPLIFWLANPLVIWSAANNMLENTMQIFVLASVWMLVKQYRTKINIWIIPAGLFLFLGFLTKGPFALFPLTFYFWIWFFQRDISFKKTLINSSILLFSLILPFALLILFSNSAANAFETYFQKQLIFSINQVQTVDSRFYVVFRLFNEMLISFGIIVLVVLIRIKQFNYFKIVFSRTYKSFFLFLFLGLSGVLPIMLSLKQSGFYMLAAFPFFSLAMAIFLFPFLEKLGDLTNLKFKYSGIISLIIFVLVFAFSLTLINKKGRDQELLNDVYTLTQHLNNDEVIDIPKSLAQNWPLHSYLARYATISLEDVPKKPHSFYLCKKGQYPENMNDYQEVKIDLVAYSLFQLNKP